MIRQRKKSEMLMTTQKIEQTKKCRSLLDNKPGAPGVTSVRPCLANRKMRLPSYGETASIFHCLG